MLRNLFRPRPDAWNPEAFYAQAAGQARRPEFYTRLGVEDRIDARFELYTLHVLLLIMRLRDEGQDGADLAQTLFDTYVSALDHTLRELGVGDLSVAKKMRRLGQSLYGRMTAYETPLRSEDPEALADALGRNVYAGEGADAARGLADYAQRARRTLAAQPLSTVLKAPEWPQVIA